MESWLLCESQSTQECVTILSTSEKFNLRLKKHTSGQDQRRLKASGHQGLRAALGTSQVFQTPWMPVQGIYPGRQGTGCEKGDESLGLEVAN